VCYVMLCCVCCVEIEPATMFPSVMGSTEVNLLRLPELFTAPPSFAMISALNEVPIWSDPTDNPPAILQ